MSNCGHRTNFAKYEMLNTVASVVGFGKSSLTLWIAIATGTLICGISISSYNEGKINVAFVPSEFSAIRAEISYQESHYSSGDDLRYSLQWNFTIGSHPAHLY